MVIRVLARESAVRVWWNEDESRHLKNRTWELDKLGLGQYLEVFQGCSGMDDQQRLDRDVVMRGERRKDDEQSHRHLMSLFHFMFILIPLTTTLITFIFKSEDTRLTTVAVILASWGSATVFERHRHEIQPLQRKKILNEQQKKLD